MGNMTTPPTPGFRLLGTYPLPVIDNGTFTGMKGESMQ